MQKFKIINHRTNKFNLFFISAYFTVELNDITVEEDREVELECTLSRPSNDVKWLKDNKPVKAEGGILISNNNLTHRLRVIQFKESDEGTYSCVVDTSSTICFVRRQGRQFIFRTTRDLLSHILTSIVQCSTSRTDFKCYYNIHF